MLKPSSLLALAAVLFVLAGCRSRPEPDLYKPGDIPTWRTVDTTLQQAQSSKRPLVVLNTSEGSITIELFDDLAPVSVANFLQYVAEGHYTGTIFHRVIPGFMVQGGGFTADMVQKPTHDPIKNESNNGLANRRGTVAMARTADVDSATSQFYINLVDNAFLDGDSSGQGYAVFGRVVEGMNVIDSIANAPTATQGAFEDVPTQAITILSARQTRSARSE